MELLTLKSRSGRQKEFVDQDEKRSKRIKWTWASAMIDPWQFRFEIGFSFLFFLDACLAVTKADPSLRSG
jgi:hypothetical protein